MKNKVLKSRMLMIILCMTGIVFIFSFSVFFYPHYYPQKEMVFLSDYYNVMTFQDEKAEVRTLINVMNEENITEFYVNYEYTNVKGCVFSEDFFQKVNLVGPVDSFTNVENVALLNVELKEGYLEKDGKYYIESGDDVFRVIGFYEDRRDVVLYETPYYINIASEKLMSKKDYDMIIVDYQTEEILNEKRDNLTDKFNPDAVIPFRYEMDNMIDTSMSYVFVLSLCGVVICLNCIGFLWVWIDSFSYEFKVRKMVGGTDRSNHRLLLNHLLTMLFVATAVSFLVAKVLFACIKKATELRAIRALFGLELQVFPCICAFLSTLCIVFITNEIVWKVKRKV